MQYCLVKMFYLSHINTLLNIVVNTYFTNARCLLIFTEPLNKLNFHTHLPTVNIQITNNLISSDLIFNNYGCQNIIIYHKNISFVLENFEELLRLNKGRFNNRQYILIKPNKSEELISNILKLSVFEKVSDILIIEIKETMKRKLNFMQDEFDEVYDLITHKFFGRVPNEIVFLDVWFSRNSSFLHNHNLFPNKLSNLFGKFLSVGTFTYSPATLIDIKNNTYDGFEMKMFKEFAKVHNITPIFSEIGDDLWGEVYNNGTGIGLLGLLAEGKLDMGFAAFYRWEEPFPFLDYTTPYMRTSISCIVPAPKLAAGWLTPLRSFSIDTWIATGLIVLLSSFTLCFIIIYYKNIKSISHESNTFYQYLIILDGSIVQVLRIFLLQSVTLNSGVEYLIKFIIGVISVQALLVTTFYTSGFASIMTIPRFEQSVKTVQDMADRNLRWGAISEAWVLSIREVQEIKYQTVVRNFFVNDPEQLRQHTFDNNFGFGVEKLQFGHISAGQYIRGDVIEKYRLLEDDIYWDYCVFGTRKNSVFLPLLDKLIMTFFETGLVATWESKVVQKLMDMSVQKAIRYHMIHKDKHIVVKLQWVHVEGAFGILVIGYILASLCLVFEMAKKLDFKTKN